MEYSARYTPPLPHAVELLLLPNICINIHAYVSLCLGSVRLSLCVCVCASVSVLFPVPSSVSEVPLSRSPSRAQIHENITVPEVGEFAGKATANNPGRAIPSHGAAGRGDAHEVR